MRTRVAALLLAILLFSAACGDDGPSETPTSTTGSTATSSTTVDVATTAAPDAPQSLQSCPGATGDSPATFDGASGTYAAFIAEFVAEDVPLTFDVVQWMTGETAREAYQEDHPDDPEGPPNDYYIRNQSAQTRQADVASDARVWLVKMEEDEDADVDRATFEELGSHNENSEGRSTHLYWLTFDDDTIVEICEQFRP